jgi:Holliday junction resolvase-like predicted endonuclease
LTTGEFGEFLASLYLTEQGLDIISRNVVVAGGEVDIVARDHATPFVVEVRTLTGSYHPLDAIDGDKRARVRRLAQALGVRRCDLIGVGIHEEHYVVHWERNAF